MSQLRRSLRRQRAQFNSLEALEARVLLTTSAGTHDIEVLGRTANGAWWAAGYDFHPAPWNAGPVATNVVLGEWSPNVDWQDVRFGDFDGDGLQDIVGRDAATGYWWTTLSDMIGSTTVVGTRWTTATTWSDVGVADLAPLGDRGDQGHSTHKSDIVGRTAGGTWWASVANGDGTFTNTVLGHWSPTAGWHDTQLLDVNSDGVTDIVSRNAAGGWWALVSRGEVIAYDTVRVGGWSPTAGWQDVLVAQDFFRDGDDAIFGRASDGAWWALDFAADGTATNRFITQWYEAADWRNAVAADLDGDGRDEVVGQTSDGQWWRLVGEMIPSERIGWTIAAPNIYVARHVPNAVRASNGSALVVDSLTFRTDDGFWWAAVLDQETNGMLKLISIGHWAPDAGWQDVAAARVSRLPVFQTVERPLLSELHSIHIFGNRAGTVVTSDYTSDFHIGTFTVTVTVHYSVPALGYTRDFTFVSMVANGVGVLWDLDFTGHLGHDEYYGSSVGPSVALGNAGADTLDGRGNAHADEFFGGDDFDLLLGDPQDLLVQ